MQFQAILLSLVILVSLLINQNLIGFEKKNAELSFVKKSYLSLSKKAESLGDNLSGKTSFLKKVLANGINDIKEQIEAGTALVLDRIYLASAGTNWELINKDEWRDTPEINNDSGINSDFYQPLCDSINPDILANKAALLKYLNLSNPSVTNRDIFELNPKKRWPIASLTKLMTSVVALEKINPEKRIIISEKAAASDGERGNFKIGEIFKTMDLIKAMLVVSSNDAATAVAEAFNENFSSKGDYTKFVDEMQKKAADLKMHQTTFFEPTGLSFINQSTVSDLAKLAIYIYQNHPEILEISRQKKVNIIELKSGKLRNLLNINQFAGQSEFLGGKTGYIEEAGRNLIAFFNQKEQKLENKIILSIMLGAENAFEETKELLKCTSSTPF